MQREVILSPFLLLPFDITYCIDRLFLCSVPPLAEFFDYQFSFGVGALSLLAPSYHYRRPLCILDILGLVL